MDAKTTPLFRPAAVQAAAGSQVGEPLLEYRRDMRLLTMVALCLVAGLLGFLATVEYAPVHRVRSYTDMRSGLARLSAPTNGQVEHLAVTEGSAVRAGALLAVLTSDALLAGGGSRSRALGETLHAELGLVEREIAAADTEAATAQLMIMQRMSGLRAEREALQADLRASEQLLTSLQAQSEKVARVVEQGFATQTQLAQQRDGVRAQESRVAVARGALSRVARELATSQTEQRLIEARRIGTTENLRRALQELGRLIVQSDAETEQVIRAPFDGTVATTLVARGQSVRAGQSLFTMAPSGEPVILRLLVPTRAAGATRAGLQIKVALSAYPREKFGEFNARITHVGEVPTLPVELQGVASIDAPVFVAVATFAEVPRAPDGHVLHLKPGMLADALVPIERRTVLAWLLDPLLRDMHAPADNSQLQGIQR